LGSPLHSMLLDLCCCAPGGSHIAPSSLLQPGSNAPTWLPHATAACPIPITLLPTLSAAAGNTCHPHTMLLHYPFSSLRVARCAGATLQLACDFNLQTSTARLCLTHGSFSWPETPISDCSHRALEGGNISGNSAKLTRTVVHGDAIPELLSLPMRHCEPSSPSIKLQCRLATGTTPKKPSPLPDSAAGLPAASSDDMLQLAHAALTQRMHHHSRHSSSRGSCYSCNTRHTTASHWYRSTYLVTASGNKHCHIRCTLAA
jgi:hypothetical protein